MRIEGCIWPCFAILIEENLTTDDDPCLWQTALERIIPDAESICRNYRGKDRIFIQIGSCSHWMSPHNNGSWFPDARFAWPSGYGSTGSIIFGLPEFDWSLIWERIGNENDGWQAAERACGRRPLVLRVALPARTARHVRAVVHTVWRPGSPANPKTKLVQGYAFQRQNDRWSWVAKNTLR
jgi:hypothetical protein